MFYLQYGRVKLKKDEIDLSVSMLSIHLKRKIVILKFLFMNLFI